MTVRTVNGHIGSRARQEPFTRAVRVESAGLPQDIRYHVCIDDEGTQHAVLQWRHEDESAWTSVARTVCDFAQTSMQLAREARFDRGRWCTPCKDVLLAASHRGEL